MFLLVASIFAAAAALAIAFVCWPLWRHTREGRAVLVAALAALVMAIAAGVYIFVGEPQLALRSFEKPSAKDARALVNTLAWRMRQSDDPRGFWVLGRGYMMLGDANDAAAAFKRALELAPPMARPAILSDYGEALTLAATGAVTPEAEAAFRAAVAGNPKDVKARFYLGQAYAQRRDSARALAMWKSLLADTPPDAPWRGVLIDRIAMLGGAEPPNIAAMVQGLADKLKRHPNDPEGWQRLVRAYAVLGDGDKASGALAAARKALAGNAQALASLDSEAHELKLEK